MYTQQSYQKQSEGLVKRHIVKTFRLIQKTTKKHPELSAYQTYVPTGSIQKDLENIVSIGRLWETDGYEMDSEIEFLFFDTFDQLHQLHQKRVHTEQFSVVYKKVKAILNLVKDRVFAAKAKRLEKKMKNPSISVQEMENLVLYMYAILSKMDSSYTSSRVLSEMDTIEQKIPESEAAKLLEDTWKELQITQFPL